MTIKSCGANKFIFRRCSTELYSAHIKTLEQKKIHVYFYNENNTHVPRLETATKKYNDILNFSVFGKDILFQRKVGLGWSKIDVNQYDG